MPVAHRLFPDDPDLFPAMHQFVIGYADWLRRRGASLDRTMFRRNDIVAVGLHYARCGGRETLEAAQHGLEEAVQACDRRNAVMYAPGRGPRTMIQTWMEAASCPAT